MEATDGIRVMKNRITGQYMIHLMQGAAIRYEIGPYASRAEALEKYRRAIEKDEERDRVNAAWVEDINDPD